MDDQGFFYIADRLKRMINAAGYKVWPAEVEATLYKHPDIREVAIVSAPDQRRGETVKAYVVLQDAAKGKVAGDDIIAWCRQHMAAYKVPRQVEFPMRCRARALARSNGARCKTRSGRQPNVTSGRRSRAERGRTRESFSGVAQRPDRNDAR